MHENSKYAWPTGPASRLVRQAALAVVLLLAALFIACGSGAASETTPTTTSQTASPTATATGVIEPTVSSGEGVYLIGDGSEATFTVNEKLTQLPAPNDAVLRTGAISGEVRLDGNSFVVSIDLHELESDQDRRDNYVRRNLFPAQRVTTITFPGVTVIPDGLLRGEEVATTVTGTVNVNGVNADLTFEIEARLDGDTLYVLGRTDFVWADFGMTAPVSNLFVVQDDVHVEVLLAAVS